MAMAATAGAVPVVAPAARPPARPAALAATAGVATGASPTGLAAAAAAAVAADGGAAGGDGAGGCAGGGAGRRGDGGDGRERGGGGAAAAERVVAASHRSISDALAPSSLHPDAYRRFHPYVTMTKRFLGEDPGFYPVLALSRVAINTHVGLFARMIHCPAVDLRVPTYPSPELRRLAFLVASSRFSCSYCTAHACLFGDVLRGSFIGRVRRGHPPPRVVIDPADASLSAAERAVVAFVAAAVVRPLATAELRTLAELAADVAAAIGARGLEVIKSVVAFTGALNTLMDVQGVVLEPQAQAFAMAHMPPPPSPGGATAAEGEEAGLWVPSPLHRNYAVQVGGEWGQPRARGGAAAPTDEWGSSGSFHLETRHRGSVQGGGGRPSAAARGGELSSSSSLRDDASPRALPQRRTRPLYASLAGTAAARPPPSSPQSDSSSSGGGGGRRANVSELMRTIQAATSGLKVESELYAGIPSTAPGLDAWAVARLGARGARFLANIRGLELRRACCFALRENVLYDPAMDGPGVAGGAAGAAASAMPSPAATPARHWTLDERLALWYVFARTTAAAGLAADAVACMAAASGRRRADIRAAWDAYYGRGDAGAGRADAARRLVLAVGVKTENVSAALVALVTDVLPPGAVVELASLLSVAEMWRRLRVLFILNDLVR